MHLWRRLCRNQRGKKDTLGGPPGYDDYLEAMSDPEHEEHESCRERRGPFDPEAFDAVYATERMGRGLPDWRRMAGF